MFCSIIHIYKEKYHKKNFVEEVIIPLYISIAKFFGFLEIPQFCHRIRQQFFLSMNDGVA